MDGLRVLVVDDEIELVNTLAERLELRNIKADVVTTGREALNFVSKNEYDVVLLDVVLQKARGTDVLREIKTIRPDLPVLLVSGRSSDKDYLEGKEMGAFDYLLKPVRIEYLIERMRQAVESKKEGN